MVDQISITEIFEKENTIAIESINNNKDLYEYFQKLLQTFYNALIKADGVIQKADIFDNYKLLNYLLGFRVISIANSAIELAVKGYPVESFTLSRLLFEYFQLTQLLTRKPQYIKPYYENKLNATKLHKLAEKEIPSDASNKLYGILCGFAHASNDILFITVDQILKNKPYPVLINDPNLISNAIHGIVLYLQGEYFSFRCVLSEELIVDDAIINEDKFLFEKERLGKLFRNWNPNLINEISQKIFELDNKRS